MKVFRGPQEVPVGFGPSAVTIGKFDGVHVGHRAVIGTLAQAAAEGGLAAVVVTFDRNPLEVLAPAKCPVALTGLQTKLDLLATTGVDAVLVTEFDARLAQVEAEEFVRRYLVDALHAHRVLIGADFRFGHGGAGNAELLRSLGAVHGFELTVVEDVCPGGARASSTRIRELLAAGDVEGAAELLGRIPTVAGTVVPGARRGRELGFPTANLSRAADGFIPADGVYAGWLRVDGSRYPAAISVGDNPTFQGVPARQVEAYAIDRDLDLYGKHAEVGFGHRIRGMVAFEGVARLVDQIAADVEQARELLGVPLPD